MLTTSSIAAPLPQQMIKRFCLPGWLGLAIIFTMFLPAPTVQAANFGSLDNQWPGIWFICEFAQRQRAPDDGCQMFDDEGFQLADGRLSYLRITQSDETACRGEKKGQCFRRDRPTIEVTKTNRGTLTLRKNQFDVRFLGCTQTYFFADTEDYREMWPDEDRCFWASERRFYIAPFDGKYSFAD
jgi:hypothetical protein